MTPNEPLDAPEKDDNPKTTEVLESKALLGQVIAGATGLLLFISLVSQCAKKAIEAGYITTPTVRIELLHALIQ